MTGVTPNTAQNAPTLTAMSEPATTDPAMPPDPWAHLDPWDRQPGEPPKAYSQFIAYRDLGRTRTVKRVAETLKRSRQHLAQVAYKNDWVERAAAWDRAQDDEFLKWTAQERLEMARAHARIANAFMGKVVSRLQGLDASTLSPADLVRFADLAVKVQRLALGQHADGPDSGEQPSSLELLSEEDRRARLAALKAEIDARLSAGRAPDAG